MIYDFDSETLTPRKLALDYEIPCLLKGIMQLKVIPPTIDYIPPLTKDLKYGMNDNEVIYLKKGLTKLGYIKTPINYTTYYGSVTADACLRFQRANGVCVLCVTKGRSFTFNSRVKFNSLINK